MEYGLLKYKLRDFNLQALSEKARKFLRDVDIVSYDSNENIFYVLLPATPADKLSIVDERIKAKLEYEIDNDAYPISQTQES